MDALQLRELQLAELRILKEIKRVCEKNHIQYYLSCGTLLGAVRHNGFIPWDDDIDVMMPIESYTRFLKVAPNELRKDFFLQNFMTDPHDQQSFTKIRLNGTSMIMPNHKKWRIHQGVWVDVFPLIPIKNEKDFRGKKHLISLSNYLQMDSYLIDNENEFMGILKLLYYPYLAFLKIPIKIRTGLHKKMLNAAFRGKGNEQYCSMVWGSITKIFPISIIQGEPIMHRFEDDDFPIPPGYVDYLTIYYGDYMQLPPVEERRTHGNLIVDLERSYEDVLFEMN